MKEIVYLDTGFLNSFLSQKEDGLRANAATETQKSTATNKGSSTTESDSSTTTIGVRSLLNALHQSTHTESSGENFSITQTEAGKELISRQLHDNGLDMLISYLKESEQFNNTKASLQKNQYILNEATFDIFDLEQFKKFGDKNFLSLIKKSMPPQPKNAQKKSNQQNNGIVNFEEIVKVMEAVSLFLPSDIFIKQPGYIFPLRKEYLRESSKEIQFKTEAQDKITILGKVKRRISNTTNPFLSAPKSMFDGVNMVFDMSNGMLSDLGVVEIGEYVVLPIAIFFESP